MHQNVARMFNIIISLDLIENHIAFILAYSKEVVKITAIC